MESYIDYLPEELVLLIIEYVDKLRVKETLITSLLGFISTHRKYYDKYIDMVHNGHINPFKEYTFDEINETLIDIKYEIIIHYAESELNEDIKSGIFYHVHPYHLSIKNDHFSGREYISKLYYICYLNCKYYYIEIFINFGKYDSLRSYLDEDVKKITIKEYKIWKDLYDNLLRDQLLKLLEKSGYGIPKYKINKSKKF